MARRRGLDRQSVIDEGFAALDSHGVAGLSLKLVADALDVRSPSLYSHVDGLGGLLDELAIDATAQLGGALRDSAVGVSGDDAVRSFAAAYRSWATTHPARYEITARHVDSPIRRSAGRGAVDTMDSILAHYGLDTAEAHRAGRSLRAALHGFVTLETGNTLGRGDHDESFQYLIEFFLDGLRSRAQAGASASL